MGLIRARLAAPKTKYPVQTPRTELHNSRDNERPEKQPAHAPDGSQASFQTSRGAAVSARDLPLAL